VRADLAGDRVKQTELKPPNMSDTTFNDDFKMNTDKICINYDNFMIMGHMNFNMLDEQRSSVLND
jgi:hypothetical protein